MWRDLIKVARPGQWLKNSVVLAALVFAGELGQPGNLELALAAAALFCLLSSSIYTFNDLFDREKDRSHPLKKNRPLASGRLGISTAVTFGIVLADELEILHHRRRIRRPQPRLLGTS